MEQLEALEFSEPSSEDEHEEAAKTWRLGKNLGLTTHDEDKLTSELTKLGRSNRLRKEGSVGQVQA